MTKPSVNDAYRKPVAEPGGIAIAFFIRALSGGGAQRDAILLANAVAAKGFNCCILTLLPDGDLRPLVNDDVPIFPVVAGRLATAARALRRRIADLKPTILFSSETAANVVAFTAARSLPRGLQPKVVLREVTSPSAAQRLDPYLQNRIAFSFVRQVYGRADRVLTLTDGARQDLIENFGVPAARITKLEANAVIDPATEARLAAACAHTGERTPDLIVAIGRLSPEKDHLTLIRAADILRRRRPMSLVIAGEGPMRGKLEREIEALSLGQHVRLAGATNDSFDLLLKARLAVSSSKFEGLGNVLVEALACGTPIVSTDCPFGPREVLQGGELGTLVPVGDPIALAQAMHEALGHEPDRNKLRAGAARFTANRAANALSEALDLA